MIYKSFKDGISLSRLGMGNMRLPTTGMMGPIDREKSQERYCLIINTVTFELR